MELLDLIIKASSLGTYGLSAEAVSKFYTDAKLVGAIWQAATASPLQFRRLEETRQLRDSLVNNGVDENDLPVPDWLTVQE